MKVQFRNIRIKKLEAAKPDAKNGADAKPSTATKAIAQAQLGGVQVGAQIDAVARVAAVAQSLTEAKAAYQAALASKHQTNQASDEYGIE